MSNKIKNVILIILFLIIIIGGFLLNLVMKDTIISTSERRKLKQFPQITWNKLMEGNLSTEIEEYAMDQFVGRDFFRSIKAISNFYLLGQKDNNGLFISNGGIYKQTGELKEPEVKKAADKFNKIQQKYLQNNKVYFAIVPDKNYYLKNYELKMDYNKLQQIMNTNLTQMQYINLFPILNEDDYYKTDTHWKQENLTKVAEFIGKKMNSNITLQNTIKQTKGDFYGVYYGQLGLKTKSDKLTYLINPVIVNSTTYNYETKKQNKVYDENKWKTSSDKYDYFVSGATPLITITNTLATEEKELLLFRDSFGSSLAPLLLEGYSKITLIDIRYLNSEYLDQYIEFKNQDVLFLYSTLVLNEASILK